MTEHAQAAAQAAAPNVVDAEAEVAADAPKQKAKKEKEAKTPRPDLLQANGVTRPADALSKTGQVWTMADKLSAAAGRPIERKAVMDALKATINLATIATQYGKWRHYNGLKGVRIEVPVDPAVVAAKEAAAKQKKEEAAAKKAAEKAAKDAATQAANAAKAAEQNTASVPAQPQAAAQPATQPS